MRFASPRSMGNMPVTRSFLGDLKLIFATLAGQGVGIDQVIRDRK